MSVEAVLSLWAAWMARSPALAAFGGDSSVELLSAVVVLWSFRTHRSQPAEQRAARIPGALIMPVLAKEKQRLSALTGSAALRADAAESALCAYLSIIAPLGLAVHAIWHIAWADPVAALAITPLIVFEAREAMRGKACGCC
jgi:divalent metal cation (Fe/Co/Zn/Cd) transporter